MIAALLFFAVAVSLAVPVGFFVAGPVPERRALLGTRYTVLIALAWSAALLLGWLSPFAVAGSAALLATTWLFAAGLSWRDERMLARFDARLGSAQTRAAALAELRARVDEVGRGGRTVVGLMEIIGHPARRLITEQLYDEALELLDDVGERVGDRLGPVDASAHRLLRARALLHLRRANEAQALLRADPAALGRRSDEGGDLKVPQPRALFGPGRQDDRAHSEEADGLEALLAVCRGDLEGAERLLAGATVRPWASWTRPIHLLAQAHALAARGHDGEAIERLKEVPRFARGSTFQLARALPGPASDLAARVEQPGSPPYR